LSRLITRVLDLLGVWGIKHALIGAGAMAAHGVSRSTQDVDFLVVDASVLEPVRWQELVVVAGPVQDWED
jgi:hypothetical protein